MAGLRSQGAKKLKVSQVLQDLGFTLVRQGKHYVYKRWVPVDSHNGQSYGEKCAGVGEDGDTGGSALAGAGQGAGLAAGQGASQGAGSDRLREQTFVRSKTPSTAHAERVELATIRRICEQD